MPPGSFNLSQSLGIGGRGAGCLVGRGAGALVAGFGGRGALCFRDSAVVAAAAAAGLCSCRSVLIRAQLYAKLDYYPELRLLQDK